MKMEFIKNKIQSVNMTVNVSFPGRSVVHTQDPTVLIPPFISNSNLNCPCWNVNGGINRRDYYERRRNVISCI